MKFFKGLAGLLFLILAVCAAYYIFFHPRVEVPQRRLPQEKEKAGRAPLAPTPAPEVALPPRHRIASSKTVSIIIDDIGYRLAPVRELLEIDAPLAFAVLPYTPHASDAAEIINKSKREILLHLPMEPQDTNVDPGPGSLSRTMSSTAIRRQVQEDLAVVPYAVGVNNHMGSAFMEDSDKLLTVLKELSSRGYYFIDSRTTSSSKGEQMARIAGIRFASRKLFLDNDHHEEVIFNNLMNYVTKSPLTHLVIIGHPYPGTVRALREAVPLMQAQGIRIVPPSEIVHTVTETSAVGRNN